MPTWCSFPASCRCNRCRCREAARTDPAPAAHLRPSSRRSVLSAAGVGQRGIQDSRLQGNTMLKTFRYLKMRLVPFQGYKRNIFLIVEKVCDGYGAVADPCAQEHEESNPGLHFTALERT